MKIIEGGHYRVKNINEDLISKMGIPPSCYPVNQIVEVTHIDYDKEGSWCSTDSGWSIRSEYLISRCMWEAL